MIPSLKMVNNTLDVRDLLSALNTAGTCNDKFQFIVFRQFFTAADDVDLQTTTGQQTYPMIPLGMRRRTAAHRKVKPFMKCIVAV